MQTESEDLIALMPVIDLLTLIEESDFDVGAIPELLERNAASPSLFTDREGYVDPELAWNLFSSIGYELDDEFFGLGTSRVDSGSTELIIARAMQEPTLGEAMEAFAKSANILWGDVSVAVNYRLDELHFCMTYKDMQRDARQIFLELTCIPFYCIFQWLSGSDLPVTRIRTASHRPNSATHLLAVFNCPVRFEGNGVDIVFPRHIADLATSNRNFSEWRYQIYQIFLDNLQERKNSFTSPELHTYVLKALRSGIKTPALIAASAAMSVATLRRKLTMERTSFRELSDQVFRESVNAFIDSDLNVESIAAEMGYSDARSFRRAFRRVFGANPSDIRNKQ